VKKRLRRGNKDWMPPLLREAKAWAGNTLGGNTLGGNTLGGNTFCLLPGTDAALLARVCCFPALYFLSANQVLFSLSHLSFRCVVHTLEPNNQDKKTTFESLQICTQKEFSNVWLDMADSVQLLAHCSS